MTAKGGSGWWNGGWWNRNWSSSKGLSIAALICSGSVAIEYACNAYLQDNLISVVLTLVFSAGAVGFAHPIVKGG
ncbi:hypothetical protein PX699_12700 [Sphingobium sp. H39-3-25]|uniref:hypothetical protein n=1 Tax=Sphingobium arseniciresistens TaxID=3030834 RepID=UPI0023B9F81D|nr:hypothetical protein [Sphingobium arseniciresistens]